MNEQHFQRKITSYLDGSLSVSEKNEFQAFVGAHPEFEKLVKQKEEELDLIRSLIPVVKLNEQSQESLEAEIKLSIQNLLKPEKTNLIEDLKNRFEDWFSR
jgi:anti-sigma factor RsiW